MKERAERERKAEKSLTMPMKVQTVFDTICNNTAIIIALPHAL